MSLEELDELLRDAADRESRLSEWEYGFIRDTAERRLTYGDATRISEKQEAILQRIAGKVYGT